MNPLNQTERKARGRPQRGEPRGHCCAGRAAASAVDRMGRPEADPLLRLGAAGLSVLAFLLALRIYGRHTNSATKLSWIIVILTFPIFGVCLYLLFGRSGAVNIMRGRFTRTDTELQPHYATPLDRAAMPQDPALQNQIHYLQNPAHYPPAATPM